MFETKEAVAVEQSHQEHSPKQAPLHSGGSARTSEQSLVDKMQNFRVEFGPNAKDILSFTNQLSIMIRAGINLPEALESIAIQQKNKKFAAVIIDLKDRIESGQSFSQALSEHKKVFSNIYINMVSAAEISGSLSNMLEKLAGYLDTDAETRAQIKSASVYPAIIAFMAVAASVFLLCFVLPKFGEIFAGKEDQLPTPTKILLGSSDFLRGNWYFILPGVIGAFVGFRIFINTPVGRSWWDKQKLFMPVIRSLCRNLYITRSLHTMGVLTGAGVPILDTISITAQVSGNVHYKNMWQGVYEEVRQGKKVASSLNQYSLMPPDVVQMIKSGEESGTMCDVLSAVSDYYGRELKITIKTVTSMIEPIMIIVMGFLVGFIAMSIMLPIFKMSSLVSGK